MFSEPNISKFDVRKLSDVKPPSSTKLDKLYQQSQQAAHSAHKYNEQDYDSKLTSAVSKAAFYLRFASTAHRTKSFPQTYVPPKGSKNMNKQSSKESNATLTKKESTETPTSPISGISDSDGGGYGNDTVSRPSNFSSYADYTSRDVSEDIDDEDPPALSERVATYHDDVSSQATWLRPSTDLGFCRKTREKFSSTRAESRSDQRKTKKKSAGGKSE